MMNFTEYDPEELIAGMKKIMLEAGNFDQAALDSYAAYVRSDQCREDMASLQSGGVPS